MSIPVAHSILDIGQRWVDSQFLIFPIPSWQIHGLWVIQPNCCCEYLSRCTEIWRIVLHIHLITLRQYWWWFFSSMCLLCLCIPCHMIQRKHFLVKSGLGFPNNIVLEPSLFLMLSFYGNSFIDWIMNSVNPPFRELCLSLVRHRFCGAARSLLDGLYGPLNDGNLPSFCTYV